MCTVTCAKLPDGYELFFNRDEQRTRKPADAPSVASIDGVSFIAPRDGNQGGTWLAVNNAGLTVGVLNFYQADKGTTSADTLSRGCLPLTMMRCTELEEVETTLESEEVERYRPFLLFAVNRRMQVYTASWDGCTLAPYSSDFPRKPISTSSFNTDEVIRNRMDIFDAMAAEHGGVNQSWLREYHASHTPAQSAYSVCMHRDDAKTVSFSHIVVDGENVAFRYFSASPCKNTEPLVESLPLTT